MSTEPDEGQADLASFAEREKERPAWAPTGGIDTDEHRTCKCGEHVSARYRRHHADEDGDVHACPECATHAELRNGRATDPDRDLNYALEGVR